MYKKYKNHIKILAILTIITLVVFFPYISGSRPFLFSADQQLQYNYFYKEWILRIKDFINKGTFPFYSFNTYLGNDFFSSKFYYLTGDVFLPFLLLFKDVEVGLMYETLILVIFSGFNFSLFLRKFGIKKEEVILVSAIVYAFSGMASLYVGQYMFHRFFCFLPLAFAGIEVYLKTNKITYFITSSILLILSNYYFLFPSAIFMVVYFFFSNYYHFKTTSLLKILKKSLKLIGAFLLAIMVTGILSLSGMAYILNNDRIGKSSLTFLYDLKVYLGYIFTYFTSPLTLFSDYGYMFNSGANGHLTWYSIYNGALVAPIIISYIIKKDKTKREWCLLGCILVLNIAIIFPPLSSIFHGFSEPSMRWAFLLTFFNCLLLAVYMSRIDRYANLYVKSGIYYIYIIGIAFLIGILTNIISIKEYTYHFIHIIVSLLLLIASVYLIYKQNMKILVFVSIEVVLMFSLHLYVLNSTYYRYVPSLDENAIKYYSDIDKDKFYRMYVDNAELMPTSDLNLNQSINMRYRSFSTYDSTIEPSIKDFNKALGFNWHIVDIKDMEVLRMLGLKYYLVSDEANLPKDYPWTYYNNVNHFKMYKLENYRSLGFTYSKFSNSLENIDWNSILYIDEDLNYLVEDIREGESKNFTLLEFYNDNRIYGNLVLDQKQVLFLSIPYNKGWQIFDSDKKIEPIRVQGGFMGLVLDEGDHYLTLVYRPPYFKYGLYMSGLGIVGYLLVLILEKRSRT